MDILRAIVLVTIAGMLAVLAFASRGESLYDCTFRLTSNKDVYRLGDAIVLTGEIFPKKARSLTLSDDLYRNIFIRNMEDRKEAWHKQGKKVRYKLAPNKPFRFSINGSVVQRDDGSIWIDFGDYGRSMIKGEKFPELRFAVMPYQVALLDSVEWGASNALQLTLESN